MQKQTWRTEARAALVAWPTLREELWERQKTKITADYFPSPKGGNGTRSVVRAALRQLPKKDQLRYDAVNHALRMQDGLSAPAKRRKLAEMVYFRRTHTLLGAAIELEISEETAKRWNADLLLLTWSWLRSRI